MPEYLLTIANNAYDQKVHTHHLIEAEDPQMVKYHYHRTQKDFRDHKHLLEAPGGGLTTEIVSIRRLDSPEEIEALDKHLSRWPKV